MTAADHHRGALMAAGGMLLLSPEGMLLRLVEQAGTWEISFWRTLFIGLGVGTLLAVRHGRGLGRRLAGIGRLGALAVALQATSHLCFVGAITNTSVANTLVLLATMPFFSALFGWLILRERVARRTLVAIVVAVAGIVVIFSDALGGGVLFGDALALATGALHGLNLVVLRRTGHGIILPAMCLAGFVASLAALPLAADPWAVSAHDFGILALIGFVQVPVAFALFFGGTRYIPAAEVALMSLIETVLGPVWAWLAVGETPALLSVIGGTVVVTAIAVNSILALRRGAPAPPGGPPEGAPAQAPAPAGTDPPARGTGRGAGR